ncbi:MAG: ribbon-helix-helix domain-containing protein [Betaproteobacteria bacterium]|jgi:predicted DNA-binding ribbon-helix-helix protein|nr:ribbon-helix-helix domain-containing protein [Rhodocyclaceae bacterium]MCA3135426.1 ribbon-helix-helix domain-containing protein [Rhodocyclaceae bacterium]MCA3143697.1 ribbon-helix-helix domain-containing protein [Rhodocyclaceae bacterium]MCA3144465.1 ribbon-helix-helix domain-containing protein [Rhodocyclaceae bacterium]MCE2897550.1 ribbon-helix-helix domain-containing protein [Betaproteobacteria bacterium]
MCNLYSGQDPALYAREKRSMRLSGFVTSICLERLFWRILDEAAAGEGISTPRFIAKLYEEMQARDQAISSFASLLRVTCAIYLNRNPGRPLASYVAEAADPVAAMA